MAIQKLTLQDDTRLVCGKDYVLAFKYIKQTVNQLVDAVNSIVSVQEKLIDSRFVVETKHETPAENVLPGYVTTTYMTDGYTKGYYGQNGASIRTDHPLPAGYVITIRESETKEE